MILAMYGAEQRAIGKYIQKVESIRDWYEDNDDLLAERLAKSLRISLSVLEGVIALIKEHPDGDDEEIADKANWI